MGDDLNGAVWIDDRAERKAVDGLLVLHHRQLHARAPVPQTACMTCSHSRHRRPHRTVPSLEHENTQLWSTATLYTWFSCPAVLSWDSCA